MVDYVISNLPRVVLDPRDDATLYDQAKNRTISASGGRLTDYSPGSPLASLITTQVFCQAELLWYLNKLPVALAIEVLRLFGVQRSLGTNSRGAVSILLSQALTDSYILPAGYPIPYRDGVVFYTTDTMTIPPGQYEGSVEVICGTVGTVGNIPALGLVQTATGLNYVNMIYNKADIQGGTDIEPLEATVLRGQRAIRSRDTLVTLADYEAACQDLLGYGSKAVAISAMDAARVPNKLGNVHVFLADAQGVPVSQTTCQSIKESLVPLTFAGSQLWVSPVSLQDVHLEAVVDVSSIDDSVATAVLARVSEYLNPSRYELGSILRVKELEYIIRSVPGITGIQYVTVNGSGVNLPMPQTYFAPNLVSFMMTQVTSDGTSKLYNVLAEPDID